MFIPTMKSLSIKFFTVLSTVFLFQFSEAQQWCGTMENVYRKMKQDPAIQQRFKNLLDTLSDQYVNAPARSTEAVPDIIYVPVVFHIVHNGKPVGTGENISDAQVQSQIDAMNLHYNFLDPNIGNVPAPFQSAVANCHIKFCLAKFDPQGNPTTGIIRHQFAQATWNTQDDIDNTLKPATIWDHTKYLNIWSVKMGGDLTSQGILAYATLPYIANASDDGVVARSNVIGTINTLAGYQLGKTVTHEVGHWLGLLHTWGLGPGCGDQGDYIADTPDEDDAAYGCPTFPYISCPLTTPNGAMFMNYMDYTYDQCSSMFTNGQNDRMHFVLDGSRSAIKTAANTNCFYSLDAAVASLDFPGDTICSFQFKPIVTIRNEGVIAITSGKLYFQIDGDVVQILNWNGSIPSQGEVKITLPEQTTISGVHTLDVTFGNVNGQAADNYSGNDSKNSSFYVYDGGTAASLPLLEGFEAVTFPPTNWQVQNPNHDATWMMNPAFSGYGQSTACMSIDNFSYGVNPNKKKDAILTDAYDFTSVTYPELKFDMAYAPYNALRYDSLNVYYSLDCGSHWTKIWNQQGEELATAPAQTLMFTPSASQWKTVSVPLLNMAGQNKVTFKFENVTGWGNVLYVDNINIANNPSLSVSETKREEVNIFPNPASDLIAIRMPATHPFHRIEVLNSVGELVYQTLMNENALIFSVKDFPSGLYFVRMVGDNKSQTEKFLVTK